MIKKLIVEIEVPDIYGVDIGLLLSDIEKLYLDDGEPALKVIDHHLVDFFWFLKMKSHYKKIGKRAAGSRRRINTKLDRRLSNKAIRRNQKRDLKNER